MDQWVPSKCSIRVERVSPDAVLPTAHTSVAETASTDARLLSSEPTFGLATVRHVGLHASGMWGSSDPGEAVAVVGARIPESSSAPTDVRSHAPRIGFVMSTSPFIRTVCLKYGRSHRGD